MWPGPTDRHPWVKEVVVDLRLQMVWPVNSTHKITYREKDYGKKLINVPDHLQLTHRGVDPVFFTILYPQRADYGIKMPKIEKIAENDLWGFTMGEDTVLFSRRDGTWKHGEVETDGRLVYMRRDRGGKVTTFAVGEATTLSAAGKKLFTSKKKVTAAGTGAEVVTDDGGAWRKSGPKRGMPLD